MKKILFVVEKPYVKKTVKEVLEKYKNIFKDEYYFDCINPIFHLNDGLILFRKYENGIYSHGEKSNLEPLTLNHLEIPNDTFVEANKTEYSYLYKKENMKDFDEIISICDPDDCGILGYAKYLEVNHVDFDKAKSLYMNDFTETTIFNTFNTLTSELLPFNEVFEKLCGKLEQNKFQCQYPRTKDILSLMHECNMDEQEFSNYFNIPDETMKNWIYKKVEFPEYLYDLMNYKLEKENKFRKNDEN